MNVLTSGTNPSEMVFKTSLTSGASGVTPVEVQVLSCALIPLSQLRQGVFLGQNYPEVQADANRFQRTKQIRA